MVGLDHRPSLRLLGRDMVGSPPGGAGAPPHRSPGCSSALPFSLAAVPRATMRNIFKRNQEPMAAPATATATAPVGPADNSTQSGGTGETKEDMFAELKEKFFNEMNKIPRKCR